MTVASGWYLRGDIGVGSQQFSDFDHHQTNAAFVWPASWRIDQKDIKDTAFVGVRRRLSVEQLGALRRDRRIPHLHQGQGDRQLHRVLSGGGRCFDVYDADHQASVFLANVYLDLGTWWCLTPFVGVGVGGARHTVCGNPRPRRDLRRHRRLRLGQDQDKSTWNFAWALHAGLAYNVSNNLKLEIAYRYLNMGSADSGVVNCTSAGCGGNWRRRRPSTP